MQLRMVAEDYRNYLRMTGAEMDLDQWREIYGLRIKDRTPHSPRTQSQLRQAQVGDGTRHQGMINEYWTSEVTKLETEIFTHKKRLADAERMAKETKAALND